MVRTEVTSTLKWSGNETAAALETIASVDGAAAISRGRTCVPPMPVTLEVWNHPIWTCEYPPCEQDFDKASGTGVDRAESDHDAAID